MEKRPEGDADMTLVTVRRQWNDYRLADVQLGSIGGLHFSNFSGGVGAPSPRPFMHGYVSCDAIVKGELGHSCLHGPGPHSIKVCVVKKDNSPAVYQRLLAMADLKGR